MSVKEKRDVAIVFDDLTEFFAIRNDVDALIENKIGVDIYIAPNYSNKLKIDTQQKISRLGYSVEDTFVSNRKYKILLEPYPITDNEGLDFEFRIKYSYSASSAKPNPVFLPGWNLPYDASISYSKRDTEIKSVYGRSYMVPYTKYKNFKKKKPKGKPNLLYLPTFGEISSIGAFNDRVISDLKEKYNLIIKAHHAIQFNETERGRYGLIKKIADEFYDSDTPLENLLARADVVLSDNSGAIFEAIYSETPVAVFSDKLNDRKLGDINTFQHELVDRGIVPYAAKPDDIIEALNKAARLFVKQKEIKQIYFVVNSEDSLSSFVSVIKEYLSKNRKEDMYLMSHDVLLNDFNEKEGRIKELEAQIQQLNQQIIRYENSNSWKMTRPLRKIKKLRGKIGYEKK